MGRLSPHCCLTSSRSPLLAGSSMSYPITVTLSLDADSVLGWWDIQDTSPCSKARSDTPRPFGRSVRGSFRTPHHFAHERCGRSMRNPPPCSRHPLDGFPRLVAFRDLWMYGESVFTRLWQFMQVWVAVYSPWLSKSDAGMAIPAIDQVTRMSCDYTELAALACIRRRCTPGRSSTDTTDREQ